MTDKLELIKKRYEDIEDALSNPNVFTDPAAMAKLSKEQKELWPIVEAYAELQKAKKQEAEALSMTDGHDRELRQLAQEELSILKNDIESISEKLAALLMPKDLNDDRSVIIEIRSGVGGEEAALFAADLFRMYSIYAEANRYKVEILSQNETELHGIKELIFSIEGQGVYARLKFESGTHRVQRVPETESSGRIHTSAVTVAVLPEAEEVEVGINPAELQIDTYRSGGAGGQHVNKTESAIRITHLPTGLVVECQDERSQHKNKDRAMKILRSRLYEMKLCEQNARRASDRKSQIGSGDRSERIRTYNFPQGRVTDHRIGLTLYKLESVLNGDMDELVNALMTAERAERLKADRPEEK